MKFRYVEVVANPEVHEDFPRCMEAVERPLHSAQSGIGVDFVLSVVHEVKESAYSAHDTGFAAPDHNTQQCLFEFFCLRASPLRYQRDTTLEVP